MNFFARLRYAAFLTVLSGMVFGLVAALMGADVIGLFSNSFLPFVIFAIAYGLAPWIERVMPYKRER